MAISILVKGGKDTLSSQGKAQIFYYDIGDYLDRERKLNEIKAFKSIEGIEKQNKFIQIKPNKDYDWINQRDYSYLEFVPMGNMKLKFKPLPQNEMNIFETFSQGVGTSRDAWVYNFSKQEIEKNMSFMIENYNFEVEKFQGKKLVEYEKSLCYDSTKISWSSSLIPKVGKGIKEKFDENKTMISMYRPFCKSFLYFDSVFNHRQGQMPQIYPAIQAKNIKILDCEAEFEAQAREFFKAYQYLPNLTICISGIAANDFSALISNQLTELAFMMNSQCFPLYYYEKIELNSKDTQSLFAQTPQQNFADDKENVAIYRRKDAIRAEALDFVRGLYKDESISKEDIFYYIYALLNHKIYKEKYKDNLSKMLPRIPFAKDFKAFVKLGKELAFLHLNYENYSDEAPCIVGERSKINDFKQNNLFYSKEQTKEFLESLSDEDCTISKMKYLIKGKKDLILFNEKIAISNIPLKAYEYVVNGRSAIEWIMERYAIKKDKDSGIENNPNLYECTNGALSGLKGGKYALHLLLSVIAMSVKSVELIEKISELSIENTKLE